MKNKKILESLGYEFEDEFWKKEYCGLQWEDIIDIMNAVKSRMIYRT